MGFEVLETYLEFRYKFKQVGWFHFYQKVQGHFTPAARAFANNFDGKTVTVGYVTYPFLEKSISIACELP